MIEDFELCYRAVRSRDARFDGWFYVAVSSTGIYCRPSCPAMTPKRANVRFYPSAAAAQTGGFRACKRCRPDATPGSPEWNARADLVGRAMRLIADGVVDREGVSGLARRLGYTERQLNRLLVAGVGAGPLALARARRAQTARLLIETTALPISEVAFAAGFSSIRQFNDTVREVFGATPTQLRRVRGRRGPTRRWRGGSREEASPGRISLRLPYRAPFDGEALFGFLGARAVPGVEELDGAIYRRSISLPHGAAVAEFTLGDGHVGCALRLEDLRDLGAAVERCRRLLDLDADPVAVDEVLGEEEVLGPLVRRSPGRRVPGCVSGAELAMRAVLGQQISVAGARALTTRLVAGCGRELPASLAEHAGGLTRLFPEPAEIMDADAAGFGLPASRREALRGVARALAGGEIVLDPGADREEAARRLASIRGVGPWTVSYVAMRALGDPDAFLPADLGVRRALGRLGYAEDPASVAAIAGRWRPWRAYAVQHLWASLDGETGEARKRTTRKEEVVA
jgi:AraC family transcriptional regulator, regulatory protein of adaptative response / DNA-3-methyladenine glycosylase II